MLAFSVDAGESNGVDLAGTKAVLHAELPGDFLGGMDKARVYLDQAASQQQRDELEAIFQGNRGGLWEGVRGMIKEFLPSKTAPIEITGGENPHVKVGDLVDFTLERMRDEAGKQATVVNAPLSGSFMVETIELANATGSASDPDLRSWETPGYGAAVPFDWSF
jgi:hypothetical protein